MRENSWQNSLRHRLLDYTRCPDCAAALTGPICARCGLRLDGDDGARLAEVSDAVAAVLARHDQAVSSVRVRQGLWRSGEDGAGWQAGDVLPVPAVPAVPAGTAGSTGAAEAAEDRVTSSQPPFAPGPPTAVPGRGPLAPGQPGTGTVAGGPPAPTVGTAPGAGPRVRPEYPTGPQGGRAPLVPTRPGPVGPPPGYSPAMPYGPGTPGAGMPGPGGPAGPGMSPRFGPPGSGTTGPGMPGPGMPGPARPAGPGMPPRFGPPGSGMPPGQPHPAARPSAPVDLAAVFALAGSGLFAVAALVFAFFLVDDSPLLRAVVLIASTGLAVLGTGLLLRRGLRSSAQAVSWLTAALSVVSCWVVALVIDGSSRPVVASSALLAVVIGGVAFGKATGMRAGAALVVLLPLVPVLLGVATNDVAGFAVGTAAAALTTLVRRPFRTWVAPDVGVRTQVESTLLQIAAIGSLGLLPLLVTASFARHQVGGPLNEGLPTITLIGLACGLVLTAVLLAVQAWSEHPAAWFGVSGFALVAAAATAISAIPTGIVTPVGAALVWLLLVRAPGRWRHRPEHRAAVSGGSIALLISAVAVLESLVAVATLVQQTAGAPLSRHLPEQVFASDSLGPWRALVAAAVLLGLSLLAPRLGLPDRRVRVPMPFVPGQPPIADRFEARPAAELSAARVFAPVAALVAAGMLPLALRSWSVALLIAELLLAVALVEVARVVPRGRIWFPVLVAGAWGQLALVALLSAVSRPTLVIAGVVLPLVLLRLRRSTAAEVRWLHTTVVVGFPTLVAMMALSWLGWSLPTAAGVVALVLLALGVGLTPVRAVDSGSWASVMVVAAVPVLLVSVAGLADRSWAAAWTAAAVAIAETAVLVTRRRPVPQELRMAAAAVLLPTVALGVVNAGAMLLPGSASPVLLPVLAVLSAAVGLSAVVLGGRLAARGTPGARVALEWSALGTGGLTLLVSLGWPTVGSPTVLAVCAVLAAGASAVAARSDRRPVWWAAAALWTGVLWSALVWGDVGLVEAYTVPPAMAAVLVASWLTRRHATRWLALAASGLALLIVPTLVLVLAQNRIETRSTALIAGAAACVGVAFWVDRPGRRGRLGTLADPFAWAAGVAALAGPIRAIWLTVHTPVGTPDQNASLFAAVLGWAALGAVLLVMVGALLAGRRPPEQQPAWRPWALAPGLTVFTVAGLSAVRSTWTVVWVSLAIELLVLALTVLSVRTMLAADRSTARDAVNGAAPAPRTVAHLPILPPAWFCWLIALAWAIGGWSLRELRVEVYALPLGIALTAAGMLALRAPGDGVFRRAWPVGYQGSMATLAPGVLATLGPSLLAIWTDPMTWRAILVVVLCLIFMVFGARELLRAPLLLGSITLGLAVLSVFGARLGSDISAGPWLLTLLSAGGLLLVLGIYSERRKSTDAAPRKELI